MAKDKKVEQITDMEVDFAQWFTDVCKKAQLIDYSSIKGVFIYRPSFLQSVSMQGQKKRWE